MKKNKTIGNISFWLAILSAPFAFSVTSSIGETEVFGVAGIVRYSWIMWLFLPIAFFSLFIGRMLKNQKQKYKKNYVAAFICASLLLIFGSYRFLFADIFSYDVDQISAIEQTTHLDLPNKVKIATNELDQYTISYVKIIDGEEKKDFENSVKDDSLWNAELNFPIKGLLPLEIQVEMANFDYFLFYNLSNNEYNLCPSNGEHECVFLAYDCEMSRFILLNRYKINVVS